ncbi:hypothetical protein AST99_05080 [Formosa algae]|nr:hypothetical protein AST99_05080 [Formosa algae]
MPSEQEIVNMWQELTITELQEWSAGAEAFKAACTTTHTNGGIQLHKFQISDHECLQWFASRNRLSDIYFIAHFFNRLELQQYRTDLDYHTDTPNCKQTKWFSDIFDLPGQLARTLHYGGAYNSIKTKKAWALALDFVQDEFDNRFNEVNSFTYAPEHAYWFFDTPWDQALLLFDKNTNQVITIDITDTN